MTRSTHLFHASFAEGLEEAQKREADYLFIELETYGGLVVDADDIRTDILNCPIPVIIYIQNKVGLWPVR